jgi:hypothetical protein
LLCIFLLGFTGCATCKESKSEGPDEWRLGFSFLFDAYDKAKSGRIEELSGDLDWLSLVTPGEFLTVMSAVERAGKIDSLPRELQFRYFRLKFEDFYKTKYWWRNLSADPPGWTHADYYVKLEDGRQEQFYCEDQSYERLKRLAPDFLPELAEMLKNPNYNARLAIGCLLRKHIGKEAVSLIDLSRKDTYAKEADSVIALVKGRK